MSTEALIARIRAALKVISPDHITPMGRRVLEKILDAESGSLDGGVPPKFAPHRTAVPVETPEV